MMDGITIGAALLPSLKAEYKMGQMKSHGMTGESSTSRKPSLRVLVQTLCVAVFPSKGPKPVSPSSCPTTSSASSPRCLRWTCPPCPPPPASRCPPSPCRESTSWRTTRATRTRAGPLTTSRLNLETTCRATTCAVWPRYKAPAHDATRFLFPLCLIFLLLLLASIFPHCLFYFLIFSLFLILQLLLIFSPSLYLSSSSSSCFSTFTCLTSIFSLLTLLLIGIMPHLHIFLLFIYFLFFHLLFFPSLSSCLFVSLSFTFYPLLYSSLPSHFPSNS